MENKNTIINIEEKIAKALQDLLKQEGVDISFPVLIEPTRNKAFGDITTSIAMKLASILKKSPQDIANNIVDKLNQSKILADEVEKIEVKGGFINFFLKHASLYDVLKRIQEERDKFGSSNLGNSKKVLLEFVSANPTGPLSIAHARQAAVGDSLGNILDFLGCKVCREYYLNDAGNQINILGKSVFLRAKELSGEKVEFPEDCYQGKYIYDIAQEILSKNNNNISSLSADYFKNYGLNYILDIIKKELADFQVNFNSWFAESGLKDKIKGALELLKEKGFIYEQEGAVWFKSTVFGDDKDRVVIKSDGAFTYLAPDIAYHNNKFQRGFEWLINIWGPDHHGYIPRIKAAVQALGHSRDSISILIAQLATLTKNGKPVSMSTRRGEYVSLRELMTEVGKDAARLFLIMRKLDSHLDFDLELAKKQSSENPVYYIQYAYARICSILNTTAVSKISDQEVFSLLDKKEEIDVIKHLRTFQDTLEVCYKILDPYPLIPYLQDLAALFHKFYDTHRVLVDDDDKLKNARLLLIDSIRIVLGNGLKLLGVSRPEKM